MFRSQECDHCLPRSTGFFDSKTQYCTHSTAVGITSPKSKDSPQHFPRSADERHGQTVSHLYCHQKTSFDGTASLMHDGQHVSG